MKETKIKKMASIVDGIHLYYKMQKKPCFVTDTFCRRNTLPPCLRRELAARGGLLVLHVWERCCPREEKQTPPPLHLQQPYVLCASVLVNYRRVIC